MTQPGNERSEQESESERREADARGGLFPTAHALHRRARVRAKQVVRSQIPGRARPAFRVDLASMFLAGIYTGAIFPFVMIIARDDLHAPSQALAFLTAAPFIGNLLALFLARSMESKNPVPFVSGSQFVARAVLLLACLAFKAWTFAIIISVAQIIGTVATPAYATVIKSVYPDEQRGRILSLTRVGTLIAQVAATMLAGALMSYFGKGSYRAVFPVAAVIGMSAALVFSRIRRTDASGEQKETREAEAADEETDARPQGIGGRLRDTAVFIVSTLSILRDDRAFRWFALSVFTYGFGNLLTVPIIPLIQVDELHVHKAEIALLTNLTQAVAVVGYFYWGRFVDRRGPQVTVTLNILLNTMIPVVYILTFAVRGPGAWWALLPAFMIAGVVGPGIDLSYFNAILTFSGPADVNRYQALQSFLLGVRGTIAPFIGAFMVHYLKHHHLNLRWAFVVGGMFMVSGAWMQRVATQRQAARQRMLDEG